MFRSLLVTTIIFIFCPSIFAYPGKHSFTIAAPFIRNAPPYMWRADGSNEMVGSLIDAHELIARQLGYKINWYFFTPGQHNKRLLNDYQAGKIDLFINAIPEQIPRQLLLKIDAYITAVSMHAFVANDSTIADLTIDSLPNYTGVFDPTIEINLAFLSDRHPVLAKLQAPLIVEDFSAAITALKQNKADYSIGARSVVSMRLREQGLNDQYQIMEPALGDIHTVMHYRQGSGFEAYLKGFIEQSLKINNNGRLKHLQEKNMRRYVRETLKNSVVDKNKKTLN